MQYRSGSIAKGAPVAWHARWRVLLCLIVASAFSPLSIAAPATLDPSFGTGLGKVLTPVTANADDNATSLALYPDGRIVVAGSCSNGTHLDFCLVRYSDGGSLDATFGAGGKVFTTLIASVDNNATAVFIQPDGNIVVSGYCGSAGSTSFCAVRYLANGVLDTTFGAGGKQTTVFAGTTSAFAFASTLQPDGKFVLAGYCIVSVNNSDFCALRYNRDGSLDTTFGTGGRVITPVSAGGNDNAKAVLLQSDGKIVLAGYCWNGLDYDFCAARYNANGSLDTGFNSSGTVNTPMTAGGYDVAQAAALQPDGKIILGGYCFNVVGYDFCSLRYLANGALDGTFGTGGIVITPVAPGNGYDFVTAIAMQPDGNIVMAGYCDNGSNNDFCAARYNTDGSLDTGFGVGGKAMTPITASAHDVASAAVVQTDGKIVVAGTCSNGSNNDFCLIRYESGPFGYRSCSLDIDGDGVVLATTDMLISNRIALGLSGNAVTNGIAFAATAKRKTWPAIRDFLVSQCGLSLPQ